MYHIKDINIETLCSGYYFEGFILSAISFNSSYGKAKERSAVCCQ